MTGCREDWDQVAESRADEIAWIKQNEDDDCPPLTAEELEFVEQFEDECTAAEFVALDEVSKVVLEFKRIERWADE